MTALSRIPFPQSITNEEFETIRHPAVDMMVGNNKNNNKNKEEEEEEENTAEDAEKEENSEEKENQNQNQNPNNDEEDKKKILSVPQFWDPPHLFKEGVRTFLGNYGERLITPEEAEMIGSFVRPLDKDDKINAKESKDNDEEEEGEEEEEKEDGGGGEEEIEKNKKEEDKNENSDIVDDVGLLETIFVSIASYRDYRCPNTVQQLFLHATYPERIRVAIVDQIDPSTDVNCAKNPRPCDEHPNDTLCKYSHLIDVYEMDATLAVGPVLARHIGSRMYRGEYFAMQSDAHMEFIIGWDVDIIQQWKSARNEMAVLTTYVSDVDSHYNKKTGKNDVHTRPKMCNSDFDLDYYDNRLANLMHGQQPEGRPDVKGEPTLSPFWAAGFSFSRGHFLIQVRGLTWAKVEGGCCMIVARVLLQLLFALEVHVSTLFFFSPPPCSFLKGTIRSVFTNDISGGRNQHWSERFYLWIRLLFARTECFIPLLQQRREGQKGQVVL